MNEIDAEIFYISELLDRGQGRMAAERLREDAQYFRPQTMKNIIDGIYNTERPNTGADISITPIEDLYQHNRGGWDRGRYREPEWRVTIQTPDYSQNRYQDQRYRDPRFYDPRFPNQQYRPQLLNEDVGVIGRSGFRPVYTRPYYTPLQYENFPRW
jgi:hypothetical protein